MCNIEALVPIALCLPPAVFFFLLVAVGVDGDVGKDSSFGAFSCEGKFKGHFLLLGPYRAKIANLCANRIFYMWQLAICTADKSCPLTRVHQKLQDFAMLGKRSQLPKFVPWRVFKMGQRCSICKFG